jgi:hypothetical protein
MRGHTTPSGRELPMRSVIITQMTIDLNGDWLIVTAQNTEIVKPFETTSFQKS